MERAKKEFDWENRKTPTVMPDGRIKAAGVAMAMQDQVSLVSMLGLLH